MISKGNHVRFVHFVLLAITEEEKTSLPFFPFNIVIKQLLDLDFVLSRIIKVSVRVISLSLQLDYSGYHKNQSNNCL